MDIDNLQPVISDKIQTIVKSNKVSNAYLLHGPKGSGKEALALQFCSLLTGFDHDEFINNPNIFLVIPGNSDFYLNLLKSSKIDQKEYQEWNHYWREKLLFPLKKIKLSDSQNIPLVVLKNLKQNIFFKSDGKKVIIIFDAHYLSQGSAESANALLKILEEPPQNTSFILVTDFIKNLPSTIQSRCQSINVPKINNTNLKSYLKRTGDFEFEILSFLSDNNLGLIDILNNYSKNSVVDMIEKYIKCIEYNNSEAVIIFCEEMLLDFNTNRQKLHFNFHLIKKWLEHTDHIKKSIEPKFEWDDFSNASKDFMNNHNNCDLIMLAKEIEYFLGNIASNTSPKLSLMNMVINSHNYLN